ncbi:hypothetical protein [Phocaeicola vulgatus]|uniref:hypothetical protein n=1 Tax=Phocaeicola vulgatus TaxID=821 RepID=UPI0030CA5204
MLHAHATGFSNSEMIELSMASTPYETKSKKDHERMQSFFGRINYDYLNKYFLSFSIRTDGSHGLHLDIVGERSGLSVATGVSVKRIFLKVLNGLMI